MIRVGMRGRTSEEEEMTVGCVSRGEVQRRADNGRPPSGGKSRSPLQEKKGENTFPQIALLRLENTFTLSTPKKKRGALPLVNHPLSPKRVDWCLWECLSPYYGCASFFGITSFSVHCKNDFPKSVSFCYLNFLILV